MRNVYGGGGQVGEVDSVQGFVYIYVHTQFNNFPCQSSPFSCREVCLTGWCRVSLFYVLVLEGSPPQLPRVRSGGVYLDDSGLVGWHIIFSFRIW